VARQRDYAAEYRRRVERGLAAGKTRQEARGHREEIRAPGEESTYATRQTRSIAAHLRRNDPEIGRLESITLAYRYVDRWGIPNTRKLLAQGDVVRKAYEDRDPNYPVMADELGERYDELNRRFEIATDIAAFEGERPATEEWDEYIEIDFGDAPDYAICLFYH
jgi:hypothetical protein